MIDAFQRSRAKKIYIANTANFPVGHCDGYDVDRYLSELARLVSDIAFDHILVHDTQEVSPDQCVAIGMSDTHKIIDNFLLPTIHTLQQGKYDTIPRNTLRHDAVKVLKTIKSLS